MEKLEIVSGEGEQGTVEIYEGRKSAQAIKARLTKERCNGERWAHLVVDGQRVKDEEIEEIFAGTLKKIDGPICQELWGDDDTEAVEAGFCYAIQGMGGTGYYKTLRDAQNVRAEMAKPDETFIIYRVTERGREVADDGE